MRAIAQSYVEGVLEGRMTRKLISREHVEQVATAEIAFLDRVAGLYGSEPHAEFIRGLRDFWLHQKKMCAG